MSDDAPARAPAPPLRHRLRLAEARRERAAVRRQLRAVQPSSGGAAGGDDANTLEFLLEQTATPHLLRLPHPPRLAAHLAASQQPLDVQYTGCQIRPVSRAAEDTLAAAAAGAAPQEVRCCEEDAGSTRAAKRRRAGGRSRSS